MQRKHTDLQHEPMISVKVFDLLVAGLAVLIVIVGFHYLLEFAGALLAVVLASASGYVGYRLYTVHKERRDIHQARLERYKRETRLIEPEGATGNYPVYFDPETNTLVRIQPGNSIQPVPHTYAPHLDYRLQNAKPEPLPELPQVAGSLALPGPLTLKEALHGWELDVDHLLLALARGQRPLSCAIEDMMHIAHDGPTGSGKTVQWKAEMAMLLKIGVHVFLVNPHFIPISKKGEDWRPIGRALVAQELPGNMPALLYTFEQARAFLRWLSQVELTRRFEAARLGQFSAYLPLYGFIDEWPAIVERYPETADYLADIIRRGRAVEVYVSANSQGFLVKDTGMSGAARENFQTAYWLGGSLVSGSTLLDIRQAEMQKLLSNLSNEQITLGKGIALLRNNAACDPAQVVRLPYADNESIRYLLGSADEWTLPDARTVSETVSPDQDAGETERLLPETVSPAWETEGATFGAVSPEEVPASVKEAAAAVSEETRRIIKRLVEGTDLIWREIAQKVGLAGKKWMVFQEVCRQMGYDTSKPRRKQGGR
jgi:hypothetical protein